MLAKSLVITLLVASPCAAQPAPKFTDQEVLEAQRKLNQALTSKVKDLERRIDSELNARTGLEPGEKAALEELKKQVDAVSGKIPVLIDGGFRRGTDILKALAIGARGVGIGRPYIYGLSSFGQEGVERVLEIMRAELTLTMRQCGTPTVASITRASVLRNGTKI